MSGPGSPSRPRWCSTGARCRACASARRDRLRRGSAGTHGRPRPRWSGIRATPSFAFPTRRGYTSDLEYSPGFYNHQAPGLLDIVCLINGARPPARTGRFTYCELGSGQGLTALALAAANPDGDFYAVDFNPAHTARARDLARAGGLGNVTCLDDSFEALAEGGPDLPAFDYITLHGVWSWVSPDLREAILRFIDRRLKPGGLVNVSYNALPGWTQGQPIQFLLHALAGEARGPSDRRMASALSTVMEMGEAGSPFLQGNSILERVADAAQKEEFPYLVHEYMSDHWSPEYHARVARDMGRARLGYAGSTILPTNYPELMLREPQRKIWAGIDDPALRETVMDFFSMRVFRSDVYLRGRRALEPAERDAILGAMRLGPVLKRADKALELEVPAGKVTLSAEIYGPILDRLAEGPATVAELTACAAVPPGGRVSPAEVAGLLIALEVALPMRAGAPAPGPVALNTLLGQEELGRSGSRPSVAVLPACGTGLSCPGIEVAVLAIASDLGSTEIRPIAEALWAPIAARGETLVEDGRKIEDPGENIRLLEGRVSRILETRLPIWRMHGALPPAMA